MKNGFVKTIIEKKLLVIILVIMIAAGGIASYLSIPKQHFQEVVLPVAVVSVVYPGASAEDMEELVTKKLEAVVRETEGFDSCTTTTKNNVCAAMVVLDLDMSREAVDDSFDDLRIRAEELKTSLPSGVTTISVDTDVMDTAGLVLAVTGDGVSGDELGQRTEDLSDQMKLLEGVRKVDVYGRQDSEVAIHVDSERLNVLDVSLAELSSLIGAQNSIIPTGTIDAGDSKITVNSSGKFENLEEIRNIVVGQSDIGSIIRLSDIAEIEIEAPEDSAYYTYNKHKANLIVLYFNSGINVVDFGDSIRECIRDFEASLPETIQVNEVYFQPDVVDDAIGNFLNNLLMSTALVLIVVMAGMNFRNALVVSVAVPVFISMLTTVSAFASLLALTGAYKQLVFTLPVVIITSLVASFLVSMCVTPLFSYFLLKPSKEKKDGSQKMARIYDKLFSKAFYHKKQTLIVAVLFMLACASSIVFIDLQVIPKAFKDVVTIEVEGTDENDLTKTEKLIREIETILDEQPETLYYLSGIIILIWIRKS